MLDIGFGEICCILIVLLVVLGPKRLPNVAFKVGKLWRQTVCYWRKINDEIARSIDD